MSTPEEFVPGPKDTWLYKDFLGKFQFGNPPAPPTVPTAPADLIPSAPGFPSLQDVARKSLGVPISPPQPPYQERITQGVDRIAALPDRTPAASLVPSGAGGPAPPSPEEFIRKYGQDYADKALQENAQLRAAGRLLPTGTPMTQELWDQGWRGEKGLVPGDMFTAMPEVPGKNFVGGWTGPDGKFKPIFEQKRDATTDIMGRVNSLLGSYEQKIAALGNLPAGMDADSVGRRARANEELASFAPLLAKMLEASKLPSDVAQNYGNAARSTAEAQRGQVVPNVFSGEPGQMSSFLVPPGGQPQSFAQGAQQDKVTPEDTFFNRAMGLIPALSKAKADKQLLGQPTDQEDAVLNQLIPMVSAKLTGGPQAQAPGTTKMTDDQYIASFMSKNPGQKDKTLAMQYLQNARKAHPELFQ